MNLARELLLAIVVIINNHIIYPSACNQEQECYTKTCNYNNIIYTAAHLTVREISGLIKMDLSCLCALRTQMSLYFKMSKLRCVYKPLYCSVTASKPVFVYSVVKMWLCKTVSWASVFCTNRMSVTWFGQCGRF